MTTTIEETTTTMYFTVNQKALVTALAALTPAPANRNTLEILKSVLITATHDGVTLATNDLEMHTRVSIPSNETTIGEAGVCVVNYKELKDLVKPLKDETVWFTCQGIHLFVETDTLAVSLSTLPVEQFPCEPTPNEQTKLAVPQTITLPLAKLREMTSLVSYAAATDDSRPIFLSIKMSLTNDTLELAAADAFRLARIKETVEGAGSWAFALLIPAYCLREALKKLPKVGDVTLTASAVSHVSLTCGERTMHIRLIDGNYPNFERIIPQDCKVLAEVEVKALKNALETVAPIVKDASNITRLHVNGAIDILAQREGMEQPMVVHVPAETTNREGEETEIIFNHKYLMDVLTAHPQGTVQFELTSATAPGKVLYPDVPGFTSVIMPMHINR